MHCTCRTSTTRPGLHESWEAQSTLSRTTFRFLDRCCPWRCLSPHCPSQIRHQKRNPVRAAIARTNLRSLPHTGGLLCPHWMLRCAAAPIRATLRYTWFPIESSTDKAYRHLRLALLRHQTGPQSLHRLRPLLRAMHPQPAGAPLRCHLRRLNQAPALSHTRMGSSTPRGTTSSSPALWTEQAPQRNILRSDCC